MNWLAPRLISLILIGEAVRTRMEEVSTCGLPLLVHSTLAVRKPALLPLGATIVNSCILFPPGGTTNDGSNAAGRAEFQPSGKVTVTLMLEAGDPSELVKVTESIWDDSGLK